MCTVLIRDMFVVEWCILVFWIKENSAILNVQTPHPSAAKDISHDSSFPMSFLLVIDSR